MLAAARLLAVARLLAALLCVPAAGGSRRDVLELADADFDYLAAEHETLLVTFYAPWCAHCKKMSPSYEKAASLLKGLVQLAKVDCTANRQTCSRFGVMGFPSLRVFRNGRDGGSYGGPPSAEGIYEYMKKQAGPDSLLLTTEEDLKTFTNNYDASIVGVFSDPSSPGLLEFLQAAGLLRDQFRFAHLTDLRAAAAHGVDSECVLLFRPPRLSSRFEEDVVVFRDHLTVGSLRRFIRDHIFGLCPHMTLENRDRLRGRDLLTAFYELDFLRNPRGSGYWRNRVMKAASAFGGRGLTFSVANKKDFLSELESEFGLGTEEGGDLPFITIRTRLGHKFSMREEFTRDGSSLTRFLEDFFAGRLKRFIRSEPLPERNSEPVKVVVAESFSEVVDDPSKDVLIQFYAPSCPACRRLDLVFRSLAEKLSADPKVLIAKMNAVDNDVPPGYDVQGFPSIFLAPAGQKDEPIRYEGPRELQDLLHFLQREAGRTLVIDGPKEEL